MASPLAPIGVRHLRPRPDLDDGIASSAPPEPVAANGGADAEIGGANAMEPIITAAQSGLPVLDGDGMGRAFPELQMVTFTLSGVTATPMVLCDDKSNSIVLDTVSNQWTERLARAATVEMGGSALLAFYPMSGKVAKQAVVRGTLTLCARIGETLRRRGPRIAILSLRWPTSRRGGRCSTAGR